MKNMADGFGCPLFLCKKASRKLSERSYLFLLVRKLSDYLFEPFDRQKLIKGIQNAIKKRPVSVDDMKNLVDDIENTFANKMQTETTTSEIGDMVLMGLKKLDHVAYVRFASVYKDFSGHSRRRRFFPSLGRESITLVSS